MCVELGGASSDLRPLLYVQVHRPVHRILHTDFVDDRRRRALALVDAELERLRDLGPAGVRALTGPPRDEQRDDVVVSTRVQAEDDRLLVLVEAWRGRRTLATGGFAMSPDGSTHTPR
jgi:hypothetical protein